MEQEKNKIIVLQTFGKHNEFRSLKIHTFDNLELANKFIEDNSDKEDEKYWTYLEIIQEGIRYEPVKYENYKG